MYTPSRLVTALLLVAALQASSAALAGEYNPVAHEPQASPATASLDVIVKMRAANGSAQKSSKLVRNGIETGKVGDVNRHVLTGVDDGA